MKNLILRIVPVFFLCFALLSSVVHAEVNIALDPTTGNIDSSGSNIDIVVDSGGGEVDGFEISIKYSGDLQYNGFTSGDVPGCTVEGLEREAQDDVFLYCFIMTDPYTGSDNTLASLNFSATGTNGGTIRIDSADAGTCETCGTVLGAQGNYTTSVTTTTTQSEALPQTNIFGASIVFVGIGLLSTAVLLKTNLVFKRREKMMKKLK